MAKKLGLWIFTTVMKTCHFELEGQVFELVSGPIR